MTSVNHCAVVVEATDAKEVSMGELRERMQQALILHGMAPRTQEAYLTAVQGIATYYHQGRTHSVRRNSRHIFGS